MKATHRSAYNKGSDSVIKMFTDKDYFQQKYELQGAQDIKLLEHEENGDEFMVEFERKVPTEVSIPSFAKKLIPSTMTVVQRDSWNAADKTGRLDIDLKGLPVEVVCHMHLEDTDTGCDLVMNWELDASVPMMKKKFETLLWEDLRGKMASDTEVGNQLLAGY
ncbi:MAG: DUF2505 domain-containing protein [Salinisphaeraceae bacterium]|nr:DUF2505 domain-containing protein [Salinisphaeraceae bacterium]